MKTTIVLLILVASAFTFNIEKSSFIPSIYDYELCRNTQCGGLQCPEGDYDCYAAANRFHQCFESNGNCLTYLEEKEELLASDSLPASFYACGANCLEWGKIGYYYQIQGCRAKCAFNLSSEKKQQDEQQNVECHHKIKHGKASVSQFETCNNQNCGQQCQEGDSDCLAASYQYYNCVASNDNCQAYQKWWSEHQASEDLPEVWYKCQCECKPQKYCEKPGRKIPLSSPTSPTYNKGKSNGKITQKKTCIIVEHNSSYDSLVEGEMQNKVNNDESSYNSPNETQKRKDSKKTTEYENHLLQERKLSCTKVGKQKKYNEFYNLKNKIEGQLQSRLVHQKNLNIIQANFENVNSISNDSQQKQLTKNINTKGQINNEKMVKQQQKENEVNKQGIQFDPGLWNKQPNNSSFQFTAQQQSNFESIKQAIDPKKEAMKKFKTQNYYTILYRNRNIHKNCNQQQKTKEFFYSSPSKQSANQDQNSKILNTSISFWNPKTTLTSLSNFQSAANHKQLMKAAEMLDLNDTLDLWNSISHINKNDANLTDLRLQLIKKIKQNRQIV